jgi:hypothetical protein
MILPAQTPQPRDLPLRVELETAKDAQDYHHALVGKQGVMVFYEGNETDGDTTMWILMHYDTNLVKQGNYKIALPKKSDYKIACYSKGHLYLLFQKIPKKKEKDTVKTRVIDVDFIHDQISLISLPELTNTDIVLMDRVGESLLFVVARESDYALSFYHLSDHRWQDYRDRMPAFITLEFCEADTLAHHLLCGGQMFDGKKTEWKLVSMDFEGAIVYSETFPEIQEKQYRTARLAVLDSAKYLIMGTFSIANRKENSGEHDGIYAFGIDRGTTSSPLSYRYDEIRARDSAISKQAPAKTGAQDLKYFIGSLFAGENQFAIVAEVFYPEYTTAYQPSTYDPFWGGYGGSVPVTTFAGYRYIHAIVGACDTAGRLLWNAYLPFNDLITKQIVPRVSLFFPDRQVVIYYLYNASLTFMMMDQNEVIEPLSSLKLEGLDHRDVVEYSRGARVDKWYNHYFLASGYQYIKNSVKVKEYRYVFFLSKLRFE